jgi:alpha/beta superfamily hydrolase
MRSIMQLDRASTGGPLLLDGPAGTMEVLFDLPKTPAAGVAVVAHPQPLLGGHVMHKVPQLLARGLCDVGWLVARPNFRGVGRSEGTHDTGDGETEDLLALCGALREAYSEQCLALVGFSFGAYVQARVASRLAERGAPAWRVALAGMPFGEVDGGRRYDTPRDVGGALVVHGEMDERVPLQAVFDWARPASHPVVVVPGADHFFSGRLPVLRALVLSHLKG